VTTFDRAPARVAGCATFGDAEFAERVRGHGELDDHEQFSFPTATNASPAGLRQQRVT
jgi:hypothetical protein